MTIEDMKAEEAEILETAREFFVAEKTQGLIDYMNEVKSKFAKFTNSRTAKIVRQCIEYLVQIPGQNTEREAVVLEWIKWANEEKRTFLRLRIELSLASLYYQMNEYHKMRALLMKLLKEAKKLDDKRLLVEIHILESECYLRMLDLSKARAAVTGAKMEANVVYVPPQMQARLDFQSGMLYSQEHDFKTAYSYFFESFEAYDQLNDLKHSVQALKMMVMAKDMLNQTNDVDLFFTGKIAMKYNSYPDIQAILAINSALENRSLHAYQQALDAYPQALSGDFGVSSHLQELSDSLFEQHLSRLIEPFSVVEVSHIAELIGMSEESVETKLAQMILDKKLSAVLDQDTHCLSIVEEESDWKLFDHSLGVITGLKRVVESIATKASHIK